MRTALYRKKCLKRSCLINPKKKKRIIKLILGLIILLTTIVFSNNLNNEVISQQQNKKNHISLQNESPPLLSEYTLLDFAPSLIYKLKHSLFGFNYKVHHITNLSLHLINILLVFIFIKLLTQKSKIALLVTLFFAIHPLLH